MSAMRGPRIRTARWLASTLAIALAGSLLWAVPAMASSRELAPVEGFQPLVPLSRGDDGPAVIRLQYALKEAGFYRGPVDGIYGRTTQTAVIAFEKHLGLDRRGDFSALDWIRLEMLPPAHIPHRWDEPDRVEIDLDKQLMYIVRDHEVVGILPTSTGSGGTYYSVRNGRHVTASTPVGDFELWWHEYGWNCDSITDWCVYNYWGFTTFYGIHGYAEVPPWPASHGCTRVHLWDSDWLENVLFVGMPVHTWHEVPDDEPPPEVTAFRTI